MSAIKPLKIFFGNITSWSLKAKQRILSQEVDICGVAEHHQGPEHWLQFKVDWLTAGWQPVIANARCNETGGTTGGVALAFRKHLSRLDAPGNHDHRWTASIFQAKNTEMLLVMLYLQVGEGPTGYTNRQVLTEVGALILTLNIPYIVMGDFNCEPEELLETTWLRRIKGNILATPDATISSGSVLDYAILSHSLWGRMELEVQHDVPWGPHYGLLGTLHLDGPLLQPCEMLEDRPPLDLCSGPRLPWESSTALENFDTSAMPECNHFHTDSELTQVFGKLQRQVSNFLSSTSVTPVPARGISFQVKNQEPKAPVLRETSVQDKQLQYWLGLHRLFKDIISCLQKQVKNVRRHLQTLVKCLCRKVHRMAEHWTADPCKGRFGLLGLQYSLYHVLHLRPSTREMLRLQLADIEHTLQGQVLKTIRQEFATWAENAMRTGSRAIHRFLKQPEAQWARPFQHLPVQARMKARVEYWSGFWGSKDPAAQPTLIEIQTKEAAIAEAQKQKPISSSQLRKTWQHMGKKKQGPDGWTIAELQRWPEEAISNLVWVYHQIENTGNWPSQAVFTQIALLPKSIVSERPICLTSFFYRTWCQMRSYLLSRWLHHVQAENLTPWDHAMPKGTIFDISFHRQGQADLLKNSTKFHPVGFEALL